MRREPMEWDFESEDEYKAAMDCYEFEEDMDAEEYFLRSRGFEI